MTLLEATLHCALEIEELWWNDDGMPTTLCGERAERYMDTRGTDWLLCATPAGFMKDLDQADNLQWKEVQGRELHVTKCQACLDHPDLPLFVLGDQ
jgi:hypothetical protein